MGGDSAPLFETVGVKGRLSYKLYASSMLLGIFMILYYRATHVPESNEEGRWAWMGMLVAELWFSFYWVITQSARWSPIYRRTFKERLSERFEDELPGVDIFVCTADPNAEPPSMVISTVLSVMAYDYPSEKLSVYLSDDAGSEITFYALWEASCFAKHWLPFCKRFKVEPRSPAAYFSIAYDPQYICSSSEWSSMKNLYEEMEIRINSIVSEGSLPRELKEHKGFAEWNSTTTRRDHQPIVQILIGGKDQRQVDIDGNLLPTLVYMAREKRPQHQHNFKAGAMNALIRVSSEISNSPIILNVDCDMYSNNSESVRDALCFFLDEEKAHNIGFVQYPQNFNNLTKNDLYSNSLPVIVEVEFPGLDSWGGPFYIGTGCFHRRESLCGRKYNYQYRENGMTTTKEKSDESAFILEERTKTLATCTYEHNSQWGKEIGLMYGCSTEDVVTGLAINCRGWKSIYFNPPRKGFLGVAPTTLLQTLVQHRRWSQGNFQTFLSKYCPFVYGFGKIKLGQQMGYSIILLWAPNSFPTCYYLMIPSLCVLKGVSLFPKVSSPWFIPFVYVFIAKQAYCLLEFLQCGNTVTAWWNVQRMWVFKRTTSYLYGTIDNFLRLLGASELAFTVTGKVTDRDVSKRYHSEVMEFGEYSPIFVIITTFAFINLISFVSGVKRLVFDGGFSFLDPFMLQVFLCAMVVAVNVPIYEGVLMRRDKGRMPHSVTILAICFVVLACFLPII